MALSSGDEIHTVSMKSAPAGGEIETIEIDAQEDREIIGWSWSTEDAGLTETLELDGKVWVGAAPGVNQGTAKDLGGKFYDEVSYIQVDDRTNFHGLVDGSNLNQSLPGESGDIAFDWNEDVVLTLKVQNAATSDAAGGFALMVYYREV